MEQRAAFSSCNNTSHAFDACTDFIAIATDRAIKIHFFSTATTYFLNAHSAKITGLRLLRRGCGIHQKIFGLISTSADKTAVVWRIDDETGRFKKSAILKGHAEGITCIGVARGDRIIGGHDFVATTSYDQSILIYRLKYSDNVESVECIQDIFVGTKYALALEIGMLPYSDVSILFAAGTDMTITLYVMQSNFFVKAAVLLGHVSWIQTLSLTTYIGPPTTQYKNGDLLLASGSQDKIIRIWKVSHTEAGESPEDVGDSLFRELLSNNVDSGVQLSTKAHLIKVNMGPDQAERRIYTVMFDALLMGHESWVRSVNWKQNGNELILISASYDKSLMVWTQDEESNVWINKARLGDVGGKTVGFCNALMLKDDTIIGNSYNGSIHIWTCDDLGNYQAAIGFSGHFAPVKELAWDPTGSYLISVSSDETARLFAPWAKNGTWHEIARPQIHGYSLCSIAFLDTHTYISGADEKILRVFRAPKTFVKSLQSITGIVPIQSDDSNLPDGASLPALGLSNKAVNVDEIIATDVSPHDLKNLATYTNQSSTPTSFTQELHEPPVENHLLQHTLWPEVNKLYGHGYELMAVAAQKSGKLFASSSKAAKLEHAAIRIWSTDTWTEITAPIISHSLTVMSLQFSNDDSMLLSVGRDRAWTICSQNANGDWVVLSTNTKAHARIIWGCAWTPDDMHFVTASRDKSVKIWDSATFACLFSIPFEHEVTAIDIAKWSVAASTIMVVGLGSGEILVVKVDIAAGRWEGFEKIATNSGLAINSVKWRPVDAIKDGPSEHLFASCSDDWTVRVFFSSA